MNIPAEDPSVLDVDSYWTVEIRLSDTNHQGARFLCHAVDRRNANDQAKRLMGTDADVRGFTTFRVNASQTENLPELGQSRPILETREWNRLQEAHAAA